MDLAELLWKTLDIYRDHGGAKRESRDRNGKVCLVGALGEAMGLLGWVSGDQECERVADAAQRNLVATATELFPLTFSKSVLGTGFRWRSVPGFNDHDKTTKAMCETVIEKTAIKVSERVT